MTRRRNTVRNQVSYHDLQITSPDQVQNSNKGLSHTTRQRPCYHPITNYQSISTYTALIHHWDISLPGFIDKGLALPRLQITCFDHVTAEPTLDASSCSSSESGVLTNHPITPFWLCIHSIPSPSAIHSSASLALASQRDFTLCLWSRAGDNLTCNICQYLIDSQDGETVRYSVTIQLAIVVHPSWQYCRVCFRDDEHSAACRG